MNKCKILFINTSGMEEKLFLYKVPLGLGYLCSTLPEDTVQYRIVDMCLNYTTDEVKKIISDFQPDYIGFSMMSFFFVKNYRLINEVAQVKGTAKILIGGIHTTAIREKLFLELPCIDISVIGEAEITLKEICQGAPLNTIKGIIYRNDDGKIISNPPQPRIQNLDSIPFPEYKLFEMNRYAPEIPIITSRGCPYDCIFCFGPAALGSKWRYRTSDSIVDEIEYWVQRGYKNFSVVDDNFTLKADRVYDICDKLDKRNLRRLEFSLNNGIRADKVDRELLGRMRSVGFKYISFGVEGGNDKVLKAINKSESIDTIKRGVLAAKEVGFIIQLLFIIGSPGETWDDVQDSFKLCKELGVWRARFRSLVPLPGTQLFEWVEKHGKFLMPPEEFLDGGFGFKPCFETPTLSLEERLKALEQAKKLVSEMEREFIKERFRKFGPIGWLISSLALSQKFQNSFYSNRRIRSLAMRLKGIFGM